MDSGSYVAGLGRPGSEADHSPPSSAAFNNEWIHNSNPLMHSWTLTLLPFLDKEILSNFAVSQCF